MSYLFIKCKRVYKCYSIFAFQAICYFEKLKQFCTSLLISTKLTRLVLAANL